MADLFDVADGAAAVAGRRLTVTRDGTTAHHFHHGAVIDDRFVGIHHPIINIRQIGIGDLPRGAVEQVHELRHVAQQHDAVGAGVGDARVLHKGTVPIKTIAVRDVQKHRTHVRLGVGEFAAVLAENAADDHALAFVRQIRAGHPALGAGTEMIHRVVVIGQLPARQGRINQHRRVVERLQAADFPIPPVVVLRRRRGETVRAHPVEAIGDGGHQTGVALQRTTGRGPRQSHRLQATEVRCDIRRDAAQRRIAPQIRAPGIGVQRRPLTSRRRGPARQRGRAQVRPDQLIPPIQPQRVVLIRRRPVRAQQPHRTQQQPHRRKDPATQPPAGPMRRGEHGIKIARIVLFASAV